MMKFLCSFLPVLLLAGCGTERSIPAVKNFEIARYTGTWYEIARLPNRFQKEMIDVSAEYTQAGPAKIRVINRGKVKGQLRSITGIARPADNSGSGELEVSFFRPFYGAYRVILLAPDYRWSVVMGGSKKLLWVLARKRTLSPADWQEIETFLKQQGFPLKELIFPQNAPSAATQSVSGQ